jgi:hypothetical protein
MLVLESIAEFIRPPGKLCSVPQFLSNSTLNL